MALDRLHCVKCTAARGYRFEGRKAKSAAPYRGDCQTADDEGRQRRDIAAGSYSWQENTYTNSRFTAFAKNA